MSYSLFLSHTLEPCWLYRGRSLNRLCFEEKGEKSLTYRKIGHIQPWGEYQVIELVHAASISPRKAIASAYASSAVDQGRVCAMNAENAL